MSKGKSIFLLILTAFIVAVMAVACFCGPFQIGNSVKDYNPITSLIRRGIDLSGGYYVVLTPVNEDDANENVSNDAMVVLRSRLDSKGFTEATLSVQEGNKIRIEIPDIDAEDDVLETIGSTGELTFRDYQDNVLMYGNGNIKTAYVGLDNDGNYMVVMNFTDVGITNFSEATAAVVQYKDSSSSSSTSGNNYLAIYLDDDVKSKPYVNEQITNESAQITGSFTYEEAESLASVIASGSLPIKYEVSEQRSISARLGDSAEKMSLLAGAIGLLIIFVIMIVYYRGMGIAASIALTIYTLLYVIFLAVVPGVQLTLPGIAGILLSIGMAVDANIVIFERVKREFANGKTIVSAVDAGFKRAVITVIDSNVTTILAAIVLLIITTGAIKGFAITLLIGVALSLLTSIFVTRWYLNIMLGLPKDKAKFFNLKKGVKDNA